MGNSSATSRRISTGTGFNKGGKNNGKATIGRFSSNKSEIHIDPLKYLAYKRFGLLNRFVFLIPSAKVSVETQFAALYILNYVFQSGQSAVMLQNVKAAKQKGKVIRLQTENYSENKIICLQPYLSDRIEAFEQRKASSPKKLKRVGVFDRIKRKTQIAAAIAILLLTNPLFANQPKVYNPVGQETFANYHQKNLENDTICSEGLFMTKKLENGIVKDLGHYAKKAGQGMLTAAVIIAGLGLAKQAQATMATDTIWGEGVSRTMDIENSSNISGVKLTYRPLEMEDTIPEITFTYITDNGGYMAFVLDDNTALPVFIDIIDQVNNLDNRKGIQFNANTSGDINAYFDKETNGIARIYSSNGQLIQERNFNGLEANLSLDDSFAKGTYILEIETEKFRETEKFLNVNDKGNNLQRPHSFKSNSNDDFFKNINDEFATYMVKWQKEGYITDSMEVIINEGWNGVIDYYLQEIPPLSQDLILNVKNLNQENMPDALVYLLNTANGQIDSLRTDASGTATFLNRILGTNYQGGVGGKEGYKVWEGFPINVPEEISNLADTISATKYTLYPNQVFSPLNNTVVDLTEYNIKEIFGNYNGMLSINCELAGWWDIDSFDPGEYDVLLGYKTNFELLTGINIIDMPNENTEYSLNDPYTELIWSNFSRGAPQTNNLSPHMMTNGPTPLGELVTLNADITLNGGNENALWKELGRLMGYTEGGENWMSGTGADIDDENLGMIIVNTAMGQARFTHFNHNVQRMDYLKDEFELVNGKKSNIKNDPSAVFVHPKHQAKYQEYLLKKK